MKTAHEIIHNPFYNKGTAFTAKERTQFKLHGLVPPGEQSLEEQVAEVFEALQQAQTDWEKRYILMDIYHHNRILFYKLYRSHMTECMALLYDLGDNGAKTNSISSHDRLPLDTVYLSMDDGDCMQEVLQAAGQGQAIKLFIVTDSEDICHRGDLGIYGAANSHRTALLYSAAAGIAPRQIVSIVLDVGTNRTSLLESEFYIGAKHKRVTGKAYYEFMERFLDTVTSIYPDAYVHFESFRRHTMDTMLKTYKDRYALFSADLEGTSGAVLAAILGALCMSKQVLYNQIYMSYGAGTAGTTMANRVLQELMDQGLSRDEALAHCYLVDKQGLLFDDMEDLTPEQRPFARKRSEFVNSRELVSLEACVKAIRPTILIGTSYASEAFTESIIKTMASYVERPIICPMSYPVEFVEARAADLIRWTDGRALVATNIKEAPVTYKGQVYEIGQACGALLFPGILLGSLAVKARHITAGMLNKAAHVLSEFVDVSKPGASIIPSVGALYELSQAIALAVGLQALHDGVGRDTSNVVDDSIELKDSIKSAIDQITWLPAYEELSEAIYTNELCQSKQSISSTTKHRSRKVQKKKKGKKSK